MLMLSGVERFPCYSLRMGAFESGATVDPRDRGCCHSSVVASLAAAGFEPPRSLQTERQGFTYKKLYKEQGSQECRRPEI